MSFLSKMQPPHRDRGFTLVEMLVVISIIALLASLIIPAVQAAIGAGRRVQCSNNLKNLALAVQQFEGSKGHLPASRTFWNSPAYKASSSMPASWSAANAPSQTLTWVQEIMPYIDRQDMRTQVEGYLSNNGSVQMVSGKINLLVCPSEPIDDAAAQYNGTNQKYSQLSYACNGGVLDNLTMTNPQFGFDWPQNGLFDDRLKGQTRNSPEALLKVHETSSSDIVDGTTNTILLAENMDLEEWNNAPTEIHVCIVWDDQNYPAPRQSLAYGKTADKFDTLLNLFNQGANFALPYARPSSFHNGGFMVAFADGHVRLVSDSIAYEVYMHLMTSDGRKYQPAGMKNLPPPPPPPATTNNAVQNVFQGVLDQGSF